MYRLLLIDDDREVLDITRRSFSERGYYVFCAGSAAEGLAALPGGAFDCVLLDVMMPDMDGFEACRKIREASGVPVIFLTGRVSEDDKVNGFLLGGDDYIEKPYSFRELEARVLANIRRGGTAAGRLSFPPLEIDTAGRRALVNREDLNLSKQEYTLLHQLAASEGETVTYEQIGIRLWGSYRPGDRRAVMVLASRLRKKLEGNPATARMVETVWTEGYRFRGKKGGRADGEKI